MNTEKDHDLLIKLNTLVEQILTEIKELKNSSDTRITRVEARIDALEKINDQLNLPKVVNEVETLKQWVRDFDTRWKTIVGIAGIVGSIAGFVMSQLLRLVLP